MTATAQEWQDAEAIADQIRARRHARLCRLATRARRAWLNYRRDPAGCRYAWVTVWVQAVAGMTGMSYGKTLADVCWKWDSVGRREIGMAFGQMEAQAA